MTWIPPPWEPPLAGTEEEHLLGALDRLRTTFRWKAGGLDAAGLAHRIPPSTLTLGRLLKHLAFAEDVMFTWKLHGTSPGEPWTAVEPAEMHDWSFASADADEPAALYALWDAAAERARARVAEALADGGLDRPAWIGVDGQHASLRRLLCDLVEEYGRHTGHADLLRESWDGLVGEDPPEDWRP